MKTEPEKRVTKKLGSSESSFTPSTRFDVLINFFCCNSLNRLDGRAGFAIPLVYKSVSVEEPQKIYSIHLFYQMFIGSIGGVASGVETGYLSFNRLPPPNTPFTSNWPNASTTTQSVLRNGSVVWNISKRFVVAGVLFDLIDKNMEQVRETRGSLNFVAAGLISGAIFGLRGGTRGLWTSSLGFGFFGGLAGFFTYLGGSRGDDGDDK